MLSLSSRWITFVVQVNRICQVVVSRRSHFMVLIGKSVKLLIPDEVSPWFVLINAVKSLIFTDARACPSLICAVS
jgi:hypothetical protein